jgi:hypothetical protein
MGGKWVANKRQAGSSRSGRRYDRYFRFQQLPYSPQLILDLYLLLASNAHPEVSFLPSFCTADPPLLVHILPLAAVSLHVLRLLCAFIFYYLDYLGTPPDRRLLRTQRPFLSRSHHPTYHSQLSAAPNLPAYGNVIPGLAPPQPLTLGDSQTSGFPVQPVWNLPIQHVCT